MKKLIGLLLLILSNVSYTQTEKDIQEYYEEIVCNSEWNGEIIPKKFHGNIRIYVKGDISKELEIEIDNIINELNELIHPINITTVPDSSYSNIFMFFGSSSDYINCVSKNKKESIELKNTLRKNWGYFHISCYNQYILGSKIFIDTERTSNDEERKHLIREELTQSLGFPNDSKKYPNSIFYSKWYEDTVEYSNIDKAIIKLHYNSNQTLDN